MKIILNIILIFYEKLNNKYLKNIEIYKKI